MSTLRGLPLRKTWQYGAQGFFAPAHQEHPIDDIISRVAKAFNVKPADIKSKKKHKLYALPRQVGMLPSQGTYGVFISGNRGSLWRERSLNCDLCH